MTDSSSYLHVYYFHCHSDILAVILDHISWLINVQQCKMYGYHNMHAVNYFFCILNFIAAIIINHSQPNIFIQLKPLSTLFVYAYPESLNWGGSLDLQNELDIQLDKICTLQTNSLPIFWCIQYSPSQLSCVTLQIMIEVLGFSHWKH